MVSLVQPFEPEQCELLSNLGVFSSLYSIPWYLPPLIDNRNLGAHVSCFWKSISKSKWTIVTVENWHCCHILISKFHLSESNGKNHEKKAEDQQCLIAELELKWPKQKRGWTNSLSFEHSREMRDWEAIIVCKMRNIESWRICKEKTTVILVAVFSSVGIMAQKNAHKKNQRFYYKLFTMQIMESPSISSTFYALHQIFRSNEFRFVISKCWESLHSRSIIKFQQREEEKKIAMTFSSNLSLKSSCNKWVLQIKYDLQTHTDTIEITKGQRKKKNVATNRCLRTCNKNVQ